MAKGREQQLEREIESIRSESQGFVDELERARETIERQEGEIAVLSETSHRVQCIALRPGEMPVEGEKRPWGEPMDRVKDPMFCAMGITLHVVEAWLNELGLNGWEPGGVIKSDGMRDNDMYIFHRRVPNR